MFLCLLPRHVARPVCFIHSIHSPEPVSGIILMPYIIRQHHSITSNHIRGPVPKPYCLIAAVVMFFNYLGKALRRGPRHSSGFALHCNPSANRPIATPAFAS